MIIIIIILLIVLIILYRRKEIENLQLFNRNRAEIAEIEEQNMINEKNKKLAEDFSNNLKSNAFREIMHSAKNNTCMFCLNEFIPDDNVYIGICKHVYHFDEIKQWFFSSNAFHNTCPECRYEFINFYKKGDNLDEPHSN